MCVITRGYVEYVTPTTGQEGYQKKKILVFWVEFQYAIPL